MFELNCIWKLEHDWNSCHRHSIGAGIKSIKSSIHTFPSAELPTFQVGNGNLQLKFSADQGKIIYGNSKSKVCNLTNIKLLLLFNAEVLKS